MKNYLCAILTFMMLLPAFLPLAPHEAAHAFYDAHIVHHGDTSYHSQAQIDHSHSDTGDHTSVTDEGVHHGVPTDMAFYYSDFLHIDLRHADADSLVPLINLDQDVDYDLSADIAAQSRYELASIQTRAPPLYQAFEPNNSSLYLTTLRLRI